MFELYKNAAATVPSASTNRVRLYVDTDGLPYVKDNTGAITPLKGDTGATGATGAGVPVGGTTNQVLAKASATNYDTAWVTPIQSVSGTSPVVSSGGTTPAISLASGYGDTQNPYASNTANYVLATPNGTAGVPTFRAIVAADIPTLNQNTTGTAANITASSNATLTTLSSLSLPGSQVSGDISGNAANVTASNNSTLTTLSSLSLPGSQVTGNIGGNAANVTGTVAIANGGTGQTTAAAAITALSGTQTSGRYLRSDGTNTALAAIVAGDVPTLNQNTTGTAANVTASSNSTLTTLSALSLPGSQVSGNISGNAANVTGIVAVANGGTGAITLAAASIATYAGTETLTNKRINPRVSTTTSTATLTPDISAFDQYNLTAQAASLTIAAPTGTPVDGNKLIFRLLDNGTARSLTWNATYTVIGVTLPTTTVINKTTYVGCVYNANNTRWDVIAVLTQA